MHNNSKIDVFVKNIAAGAINKKKTARKSHQALPKQGMSDCHCCSSFSPD